MYDFTQLSPADFEELTRDLLQRYWRLRLESFKGGRDQGIDLRHTTVTGHSIIVQCKHFAKSDIGRLVRELRNEEAPKVRLLAPKRYVIVTSLPLNPSDKDRIMAALQPFILTTGDIIGSADLNNLLRLHPEVEQQHFKLWLSSIAVLQRVLDNAGRVQTDFHVDRVRRAIPLYVQNSSYSLALKILDEHKFVVISGVPGIGKTTLADMLLYAHLESEFEPVVIQSNIYEGRRRFNPDVKQIFYFDDFLGETFLGNRFDFVGKREDSAILDFMELITRSKHGRLILTAREHILQHAFQISERFQRGKGTLADHRCILELSSYNLLDKGRILYNHIYFSDLPDAHKDELLRNRFYMLILKHRNFNPRLVEWLSKFTNVKPVPVESYREEVERVLEDPAQLWRIAFERQISEASRSLLLALYSLGGNARIDLLEESWRALHRHRAAKYLTPTAAEDWRRSLQDLEGGFLNIRTRFGVRSIAFINPSVKDFFDTALVADSEHLDDLLSSVRLFDQVVNLWSLTMSEKGADLRARFEHRPERLLEVVLQNLQNPYSDPAVGQGQSTQKSLPQPRDSRPEVRLRTLVSIASETRAPNALEAAIAFKGQVIEFWTRMAADFAEAAGILRIIDGSGWPQLRDGRLHSELKGAILHELSEGPGSDDIAAVVAYAEGDGARWSDDDRALLIESFEYYLDNRFSQELADCSSETDFAGLAAAMEDIGSFCEVDVTWYQAQVEEASSELTARDNEDDDNRPTRWEERSSAFNSEHAQEIEIRRLFGGL